MTRFSSCLVWLALGSVGAATDSPVSTQKPLVAPKPATAVDETELERMKTRLAAIVRSGSATALAAELARIDRRLRSQDLTFEERAVAMEQCFRVVATTPEGHLPKFRAVCRPFAVEIDSRHPSVPVSGRFLRTQLFVFFEHLRWGESGAKLTALEQSDTVETLLRIWDRAEASFHARRQIWESTQASFGQPLDFEEVAAGRQFLSPLPAMAPESVLEDLYAYPFPIDPSCIKEPEARQACEDLYAAEHRRMSEYGDVREVYLVMQGYDDQSRQFLAEVYGPDFANALEFREAVARVIKDEDQARRIIDRLRPEP